MISFASDNNSGVHPKIMEALAEANRGHCGAYSNDPYTAEAVEMFRHVLGQHVNVSFVLL